MFQNIPTIIKHYQTFKAAYLDLINIDINNRKTLIFCFNNNYYLVSGCPFSVDTTHYKLRQVLIN